jgi:NADPH:quinone reductase-like Zn-dependent oxidoreductase
MQGMSDFPRWKYFLVAIVLVLGILYGLPNVYVPLQAVQVTPAQGASLDPTVQQKVITTLQSAKIPYVNESLKHDANRGDYLVIGFANGRIQQIPANILLVKNVSVLGFNYGKYIGWGLTDERHRHENKIRAGMETMFRWFEEGKLHPSTSHRFPLEQHAAALDAVLARRAIGKIVLEMPRATARRPTTRRPTA